MIGGINTPLAVVLTWPTPDPVNPVTRPATILVLTCILGPISIGLSLARLWVRVHHQKNADWDDWLMGVATILMIAITPLFPLAVQHKFDRHIWDMDIFGNPENVVTSRKYILAIQMLFCALSGFIKVSILLFYRRLGGIVVSRTFRWMTWISICSIVAYTVVFLLCLALGCRPLEAYWQRDDVRKLMSGDFEFHCIDEGALMVSASIISMAQDLIAAILPSSLYWNVQIPFRKKVMLFAIFAIGYGVGAIGALRAYYSWYVFYDTYDITWAIWDLLLVVMLETYVGAFCANAPALRTLWRYLFRTDSGSRSGAPTNSKGSKDNSNTGSSLDKRPNFMQRMGGRHANDPGRGNTPGYNSTSTVTADVRRTPGTGVPAKVHHAKSQSFLMEELPSSSRCDLNNASYDRYSEDTELGCSGIKDRQFASSANSFMSAEEDIPEALPPCPSSPLDSRSGRSTRLFAGTRANEQVPRSPLPAQQGAQREDAPDYGLFSLRSWKAMRLNDM